MRDFRWRKYLFIFFLCFVMAIAAVGLPGVSSASNKPVKLKVVTYLPKAAYGTAVDPCQLMVDYINLYGKSRGLSAEFYHSQTVYKAKEMLPALISGSIDIAMFMGPGIEGTLPFFGATDLPFIWGDVYIHREGARKGSPFFNVISKECSKKGLQLLALPSSSTESLLVREPLTKLEDFKGLKIRVAGAVYAKALQSIGAVPISMPSSEVYTSLQRGVVDASMGLDMTFYGRKLGEVAKYLVDLHAFRFDFPALMNKGSFERLSEEQKKVVWNAAEWYRYTFSVSEMTSDSKQMRNLFKKVYKVKEIYISESEKARINKAMWGPTVKWWKKRVGPELADKILKAIEESKNWRKSKFGFLDLYPLKY